MFPRLLIVLFLFPPCVLVPGFLALRRSSLPEELRLSASVAVSVAMLYGTAFILYLVGAGPVAYHGVVLAILLAAARVRRELLAFLRSPAVAAILLNFAVFTTWLLLLSFFVRNFSGGLWAGDWEEHYQRAVFFLGGLPLDTQFIGIWSLPARPPLDNLVAAFFMAVGGTDFATYQLTAVLLASLEYLGAAALLIAMTPGGTRRYAGLLLLTAFLCLNPSVVQNATYPWTRALTNFFLLQGAAFYVRWLEGASHASRRWCHILLGLALATHYSAVPYLVGLFLVEAWLLVSQRLTVRETALAGWLVAAPVAPWIAFALARFGVAGTFLANSTVTWNAQLDALGIASRALANLSSTLVPHFLRQVPALYAQEHVQAQVRDFAFLIYQVSLPALMGSIGGLGVAGMLVTDAVRGVRAHRVETPALVALFLSAVTLLGVATVALDDPFGVAHVCLQPLGVAGLVFLPARWRDVPTWLRTTLGLGLAFDAMLGIGLHFWLQHLALPDLAALDLNQEPLPIHIAGSLADKLSLGQRFLGDLPGGGFALAVLAIALASLLTLLALRSAEEARPRPDSA